MLFNSWPFLFAFMPLTLFVASRLKGQPLLRFITVVSFLFYALAGHIWFLWPMLVTTTLDFYLAPRIAEASTLRAKRGLLLVSLCANMGLLFYFKYGRLFATSVQDLLTLASGPGAAATALHGWLSVFDVVLPAGISFYTFQTVSYVVDVYRGTAHPETNFWKFAGFVSFFPHLVAGPLTRHHQLLPALTEVEQGGIKPRWEEGVFLFAVGLCKKVLIADRIAFYIDPQIGTLGAMGFSMAWLALVGYSLQIYFDFSGYSDMATGLGRLFGIELPKNFNSPYQTANPADFWRRWHITLSLWLRDYLYISLGGNRAGPFRRNVNLMTTMVLGGLWHGANWTFAAWGFYHGALLVVFHSCEGAWSSWPRPLQRALTFLLVTLGWVFFRAPDFAGAQAWFSQLFSPPALSAPWPDGHGLLVVLVAAGLLIAWRLPNAAHYEGWGRLSRRGQAALGLATVAALLFMNYSSKFLYFQF